MSFTQPQGSSAPAGDDTRYSLTVGGLGGTLAASWLHLQLPAREAHMMISAKRSRKRSTRAMRGGLSLLGDGSRFVTRPRAIFAKRRAGQGLTYTCPCLPAPMPAGA